MLSFNLLLVVVWQCTLCQNFNDPDLLALHAGCRTLESEAEPLPVLLELDGEAIRVPLEPDVDLGIPDLGLHAVYSALAIDAGNAILCLHSNLRVPLIPPVQERALMNPSDNEHLWPGQRAIFRWPRGRLGARGSWRWGAPARIDQPGFKLKLAVGLDKAELVLFAFLSKGNLPSQAPIHCRLLDISIGDSVVSPGLLGILAVLVQSCLN
mmetsp:Transcript_83000/g.216330  ORF Transcript_83000/g.216330 Transcript_83000/m.216330 type:complete len:210 (+) Transcript_83000:456-1085(+)